MKIQCTNILISIAEAGRIRLFLCFILVAKNTFIIAMVLYIQQ